MSVQHPPETSRPSGGVGFPPPGSHFDRLRFPSMESMAYRDPVNFIILLRVEELNAPTGTLDTDLARSGIFLKIRVGGE